MTQPETQTPWIIRRSKLVVAPHDKVAVDAALASGADAVVLDLAHAPSTDRQRLDRSEVPQVVAKLVGRGMDILTWVSASDPEEDLAACMHPQLTGALVSASTEDGVWRVDRALASQEASQGIPVGSLQVELALSSARAVLDLDRLAMASPRITCLNLDPEALAADMGVEVSEEVDQFLYARGRMLVVARMLNMQAHTLAFVPRSESGEVASVQEQARRASKQGYRGALCWDPAQVPLLNGAYGPTDEEVAYAREAKEAMEEALRQGKGAATLRSGALLDIAMLRHSEAVLSWAQAIADREKAKAGGAP